MTKQDELKKIQSKVKAAESELEAVENRRGMLAGRLEFLTMQKKGLLFLAEVDQAAKAELEKCRQDIQTAENFQAEADKEYTKLQGQKAALEEEKRGLELAMLQEEHNAADRNICQAWLVYFEMSQKMQEQANVIDKLAAIEKQKLKSLRAFGGSSAGFILPNGSDVLKLEALKERIKKMPE